MRVIVASLVALWLGAAGQAAATPYPIAPVRPALETPGLPDNAFESDADDPAIWVHPTKPRAQPGGDGGQGRRHARLRPRRATWCKRSTR